jgi:hypothetical protein
MARWRKILIWMMVIAMGILLAEMIWPSEGLRLLCIFYSAPVAVVSNLVWLEPEMGEKVFTRRKRIGE